MIVRRSEGYEGPGTRKDEGIKRYIPYIMTFLMFLMTTFVGILAFFYKEDRQNTKELILQVSQTLSEFKKDVDVKFAYTQNERLRLYERNEEDKKDIRQKVSDIKYQCCGTVRRSN